MRYTFAVKLLIETDRRDFNPKDWDWSKLLPLDIEKGDGMRVTIIGPYNDAAPPDWRHLTDQDPDWHKYKDRYSKLTGLEPEDCCGKARLEGYMVCPACGHRTENFNGG